MINDPDSLKEVWEWKDKVQAKIEKLKDLQVYFDAVAKEQIKKLGLRTVSKPNPKLRFA